MPPRTIPQIMPKGIRPKVPLKVEEEKPKPPSDDDEYGDDFEEEEAEKEILAKPFTIGSKKIILKDDDFKKTTPTKEPPAKETPLKGPSRKAAPVQEREEIKKSPAPVYQEEEPVRQPKIEVPKSFAEDKKRDIVYVDEEMREMQRERVRYLREFLALEYERFDNLLEILPSSEYELYVNRIQSGVLANSGDQTNDERSNRETQTEDEFQNDFSNQWPDDKNRNVFTIVSNRDMFTREETPSGELETEDTNKLIEFVKNAYPVMDEILTYQSKNATSKDKMLNIVPVEETLEFPSELSEIFEGITVLGAFDASKNQIFISYKVTFVLNGRKYPLGLIIEYLNSSPSRYFIALSEIVTLYVSVNFKHALLGGTKEGSVLLWDLRDSNLIHSKNVHEFIGKIKEKEGGRFGEKFIYRFPNYSTDYLGENGHNSPVVKIKDIYSSKNVYEVFSLDEFGKVINWNIAVLNKFDAGQTFGDPGMNIDSKIKLVKIAEFDIIEHYSAGINRTEALLCFDMDIDKQGTNYCYSLFICNQKGIAKIETVGQAKPPKTYDKFNADQYPTCIAASALEYLYVGNRDGTISILSKNFSKPIASIGPFAKKPLTHLILPKYYPITLRNPSKYLEQLTKPVAFDKEGNIYFFSFDQNFQPCHIENLIKGKINNQPFKLLHVWFESNLDMHMLYSVNKNQVLHLNYKYCITNKSCSKVLDVTHEPIMQKQKKVPLLFKVT